jgi:hypothetical protein
MQDFYFWQHFSNFNNAQNLARYKKNLVKFHQNFRILCKFGDDRKTIKIEI